MSRDVWTVVDVAMMLKGLRYAELPEKSGMPISPAVFSRYRRDGLAPSVRMQEVLRVALGDDLSPRAFEPGWATTVAKALRDEVSGRADPE